MSAVVLREERESLSIDSPLRIAEPCMIDGQRRDEQVKKSPAMLAHSELDAALDELGKGPGCMQRNCETWQDGDP